MCTLEKVAVFWISSRLHFDSDLPLKLVQEERENPVGSKSRKGLFQMAQKRYCVGQIISKLRRTEVVLCKGKEVPEVCKLVGVVEQTYYR